MDIKAKCIALQNSARNAAQVVTALLVYPRPDDAPDDPELTPLWQIESAKRSRASRDLVDTLREGRSP